MGLRFQGVRRSLILAFVTAVPSLAMGVGCSVFGDFGAYSTEDPSAGGDSGVDVAASSSVDAAGATDASDGATDTATSDAGAPFCTPGAHAFCADFEDPNALTAFTSNVVATNGVLEVSTTRAKGGARSLFTSLPRRETGKMTSLVNKSIDGIWRRTVVELDMFIDPIDWKAGDVNAGILEMGFYSPTQSHTLIVILGEQYCSLAGAGTPDTSGAPVEMGKWLHLRAELTTTLFTVVIDGSTRTHAFALPPSGDQPRFAMGVGIDGFNAPVPRIGIYYDNITVDFPP
jgi:hypothetical protein